MGLFYRRENPGIEVPYTINIGNQTTKLIVGLGNPGKKYDLTRHNIGFMCLDALATAENGEWHEKKALKSLVCDLRIGQTRVVLCKPTTYMNASGEAVQALQAYFKLTNAQTVVVYDELDMPFGQIRTRLGGSAAGHNGVKSLIQHIGEDFGRVRIGVANEFSSKAESSDFVLGKFTKEEQGSLKTLTTEVLSLLNEFAVGDQLHPETRNIL